MFQLLSFAVILILKTLNCIIQLLTNFYSFQHYLTNKALAQGGEGGKNVAKRESGSVVWKVSGGSVIREKHS